MSDLTPVTAYADKRGVLHRTELEVYNANNEYDKKEYVKSIYEYFNSRWRGPYQTGMSKDFLNSLSIPTLRMMCIDLQVLNQ